MIIALKALGKEAKDAVIDPSAEAVGV